MFFFGFSSKSVQCSFRAFFAFWMQDSRMSKESGRYVSDKSTYCILNAHVLCSLSLLVHRHILNLKRSRCAFIIKTTLTSRLWNRLVSFNRNRCTHHTSRQHTPLRFVLRGNKEIHLSGDAIQKEWNTASLIRSNHMTGKSDLKYVYRFSKFAAL